MGQLGALLREARERQGITLEQVEEVTRIRRVFLEALEEERFADLPGEAYAKGFVRNYALFLKLNPDEALAAYRVSTGAPPSSKASQVLDRPLVKRPPRNVDSALFLFVMVALVLGLAGWYVYNRFYLGVDPLPALYTLKSPTATPTRPTLKATATASPTYTAEPSPTATATATSTPTENPTETPTKAPTETPASSPTSMPITGIQVNVEVLAKSYVEVTLDGEKVFSGILERGDTRFWSAKREFLMRVGNAGGLKLTVNGVEVGPLGKDGEVLDVRYTLDNLPHS